MKITSFGTTTLLFDDGSDQILFDANFTRPSIPKYLFGNVLSDCDVIDRMFEIHKIDRLRAIFVSHSHYDHVIDAAYIAKKTGAKVFGSISTKNICLGKGLSEDQIFVYDEYNEYNIGDYKIKILPAVHSKPSFYNDDLGKEVLEPLEDIGNLKKYKEGGSYDFYILNGDKKYLIHPSCNFIIDELKGYDVDVLFLALAGVTKMDDERREEFFKETISCTGAKFVIPVHWDNFFRSLDKSAKGMIKLSERTDRMFFELVKYCENNNVSTLVQLPRASFEI